MLFPPWLESLLSTPFFSVCPSHRDSPRNECNLYCLDCDGLHAFCYYCRSSHHKDHRVIQIRRSSYHNVVRVSEIEQVLYIGEVQTYVINSARVVFLNERPQPRVGNGSGGNNKGGVSHTCEVCGRSLLDPFRFCSLGCKLVGIKRDGDMSFALGFKKEGEVGINNKEGMAMTLLLPYKEEEALREGSNLVHVCPSTPPRTHHHQSSSTNSRRRKGIPRRAPL